VPIGGRTLLRRHLDHLSDLQAIAGVTIVVGYEAGQIEAEVAAWRAESGRDLPVRFVLNERFRKGSILSLYAAREVLLGSDAITMDADVLYGRELMERLIHTRHPNCGLLDDSADETGEEMMLCVRDGLVRHIARSRDPSTHTGWDRKGESVGFFRFTRKDAPRLLAIIEELVAAGGDTAEYEAAIAVFMSERECGFESVGDLPWTEIDFPEDVARAEERILPRLLAV
jgi:choline kinase